MDYTAGVITLSDKGFDGQREDLSGRAIKEILERCGFEVKYSTILPDDFELIKEKLIECSDEMKLDLICTTGGTGFSKRDITPEATLAVVERLARGIPEAMRAESMKKTNRAILSRAEAGIRGESLIVNLPGSEKAVRECLGAVVEPLKHGIEILKGEAFECGKKQAKVLAVCLSNKKGEQKHPVEEVILKENHGIIGDAHAGNWHRQVSLLAIESVAKLQVKVEMELKAGDFAENILTEAICLYELKIGTKLQIGSAICEVTQIGKECHNDCVIKEKAGDCVMPREGIFVKVLKEGKVKAQDSIIVL